MHLTFVATLSMLVLLSDVVHCRILRPTTRTDPDVLLKEQPYARPHALRKHRIHRELNAVTPSAEATTEPSPKYNHNCFFTPINCQHKTPLRAVKVNDEDLKEAEKKCKDCKLRPALGFLRRRKYFFTK
ncbi:hypothetical protein AAVH_20167 [Aphelenchoides avenae]|nr:hypothetical protein AAVH_20167 [Aphelenchus avenae]